MVPVTLVLAYQLSASAQQAPEVEFLDSGQGVMSAEWGTVPGYLYRLRSSGDLQTWQAEGSFYGLGQTQSYQVAVGEVPGSGELPEGGPPARRFVPIYPAPFRRRDHVSQLDGSR